MRYADDEAEERWVEGYDEGQAEIVAFLADVGFDLRRRPDGNWEIAEQSTKCAACGRDPAPGFAMVNDDRYCHPDEGPSCYGGGDA